MITPKLIAILISMLVFAAGCTQDSSTSGNEIPVNVNSNTAAETPVATPVDDIAAGKKHYVDNCVRCHKEDGTGGPVEIEGKTLKPDDLTTEKMKAEPDEEYMEYMEKGIEDEGMPAFKDILSEDEMKQVVKYIRSEIQK